MKDKEYLNECFEYDETTGDLSWKERPLHHFSCDRFRRWHASRFAGHVIRSKDSAGYYTVMVNHVQEKAHRVIWVMHNGPIPDGMQIDHLNGDRNCNILSNLRIVSIGLNAKNRKMRSDNKTGVNGVCFENDSGKYVAYLTMDGKQTKLGRFDTIEEAKDRVDEYSARRCMEGYTERHATHL